MPKTPPSYRRIKENFRYDYLVRLKQEDVSATREAALAARSARCSAGGWTASRLLVDDAPLKAGDIILWDDTNPTVAAGRAVLRLTRGGQPAGVCKSKRTGKRVDCAKQRAGRKGGRRAVGQQPVVHLSLTRGGTLCGVKHPKASVYAIDGVTCGRCEKIHKSRWGY